MGAILASDQHPDHHVREGERFIATVYNALRQNPALWATSALLVTYDEHGGIYDHVPPPACVPDGFVAQPAATGTGQPFLFDRLGVRVPAVLVSPWIPKGTVVEQNPSAGTQVARDTVITITVSNGPAADTGGGAVPAPPPSGNEGDQGQGTRPGNGKGRGNGNAFGQRKKDRG